MQRVTRSTAAAALPLPPAAPGTPGFFAKPDPVAGIPATIPGYEWFNAVQEELIALLMDAGLTPNEAVLTQLRQTIRRLAGANVTAVTGTTALTADAAGVVTVSVTGAATITLPAANAAGGRPLRLALVRTDATTHVVTLQRAGGDTIEGQTSITLPAAGRMVLMSDGAGGWRVLSDGGWGRSIANPGWVRLPGGMILQWGVVPSANVANTNVTWPIAFPNACLWAGGTGLQASGGVQAYVTLNSFAATGGVYNCFHGAGGTTPVLAAANAVHVYYFAIGY